MADYRKLRIWGEGHALAVEVERVVEEMRKDSTRDLCDQMSRAARSIPTNIVEGSAHDSPHQFARYLQYSLASTSKLEEHVETARDVNAISCVEFEGLMKRIVSERRQIEKFRKLVQERGRFAKRKRANRKPRKRKRP